MMRTFLLERAGHLTVMGYRLHAPRYFSARWKYQAGRNFLRLYLGPIVLDINMRKRGSGD